MIKFNINVSRGRYRNKSSQIITEIKITTGSFGNRATLESCFGAGGGCLDINECRFQLDGMDVKRANINDFINKYLDFRYKEHRRFAKVETYIKRSWLHQVVAVEHDLYFNYL